MGSHWLSHAGTVGYTLDDALRRALGKRHLVIVPEGVGEQLKHPRGQGNHSPLALFAVRSPFAVYHQALCLPQEIRFGHATELLHPQVGIEQGPETSFSSNVSHAAWSWSASASLKGSRLYW